jgi:hypothetical protein
MKVISPGVVALKPFKIHCRELTQEMVDWWVMMGAEAQVIQDEYWTRRTGTRQEQHYRIRMPALGAKWSHRFNDESGNYLIHLMERYAPEASLFILKWPDNVINHDIVIRENNEETVL